MTVEELIHEVEKAGATLHPEPPDLVVRPAGVLTADLKDRLREHKPDILRRLEMEQSRRILEAEDIRIALWITETDAGAKVTDRLILGADEARLAGAEGALVFTPADMFAYIELDPHSRELMRNFMNQFPGAQWKWTDRK